MTSIARSSEPRRTGMHLGRRFGDVVATFEADEELAWFFNEAAAAIQAPSSQGDLLAGRKPGSALAVEQRAEALHAARKIWERLLTLGPREARVLEALYTERSWPRAIVQRLEPLAGVVESLVEVRSSYLAARMSGRTTATAPVAWIEERIAARSEEVRAWREAAGRASGRALAAYARARGGRRSVVPRGDL